MTDLVEDPDPDPQAGDGAMPAAGSWPLNLPPVEGEAFAGWVRAMAGVYQSAPKTIAKAMGLPVKRQTVATFNAAGLREGWRVAAVTGNPVHVIKTMAAGWEHPSLASYVFDTGGGFLKPAVGSSFCPACLAGSSGRWLSDWHHRLAIVCPVHGIRLERVCPGCGQRPWRSAAWLWTTAPGWQCAGTATTVGIGNRRQWCHFDLRRSPRTMVPEPGVLEAQAELLRMARLADRWPHASHYLGDTEVVNQKAFHAFLDILEATSGFRLSATGVRARSAMLQALPAAHRKLLGLATSLQIPTPTQTAAAPQRRRRQIDAAKGKRPVGAVHVSDLIPVGFWPEQIAGLDVPETTLTRIALAVGMSRMGSNESWSKTGSRFGLQYKDHQRIPHWWVHLREHHDPAAIAAQLQLLLVEIKNSHDPVDYGQRRREAARPEFFTDRNERAPNRGVEDGELLQLWALHTGGDARFPPAAYQHLL